MQINGLLSGDEVSLPFLTGTISQQASAGGGGASYSNTKSVSFDGNSDDGFITCDNKDPSVSSSGSIFTNLETDQAWSFPFWIKTTTGGLAGQPDYILGKFGSKGFVSGLEGGGNLYTALIDSSGNRTDLKTNTSLSDGNWHFIALVYDGTGNRGSPTSGSTSTQVTGSALKVYIDGGSSENLFFGFTNSSAQLTGSFQDAKPLVFGGYSGSPTANLYIGNLDEVAFWDVALSQSEASAIYNSGSTTDLNSHSQASKLISWWRMGDGTGDTLSATSPGATNLATNLIKDMSTAVSYTRNDASAKDRAATADCEIVSVSPG